MPWAALRATLDDAGVPIAAASYDAWGVPETPLIAPFGFTGELQQGSDVWLRARWYGAGRGSFGGRDPYVGDAQTPYSLQYYQYGYSAPTVWTDASGEAPCVMSDVGVGPCIGGGGMTAPPPPPPPPSPWHALVEGLQEGITHELYCQVQEALEQAHQQSGRELREGKQYARRVLVVGEQTDYPYARALATKHPDWEVIGSSYGASNSQNIIGNTGNLTLLTNVDATRLEAGAYTQKGGFNDIVFNGPRAVTDWKDTPALIDAVLANARLVLAPGGVMRFSGTSAMPGGTHLNNLTFNKPSGYSKAQQIKYESDEKFYIPYKKTPQDTAPYTMKDNYGEPLYPKGQTYWYNFKIGG